MAERMPEGGLSENGCFFQSSRQKMVYNIFNLFPKFVFHLSFRFFFIITTCDKKVGVTCAFSKSTLGWMPEGESETLPRMGYAPQGNYIPWGTTMTWSGLFSTVKFWHLSLHDTALDWLKRRVCYISKSRNWLEWLQQSTGTLWVTCTCANGHWPARLMDKNFES